jgi:hypothetical protein
VTVGLSVFGIAAITGGILLVAAWAMALLLGNPTVNGVELSRWVAVPAHVLLLLGLVGIYFAQAVETGKWGLAGFVLPFAGMAIFIGYVIGGWNAAIPEPRLGPLGGVTWLSGLLILAVVTWRAGVLPGWAGVLWMAGAVLYATGVPVSADDPGRITGLIGSVLIAAGFGWAGATLLSLGQSGATAT